MFLCSLFFWPRELGRGGLRHLELGRWMMGQWQMMMNGIDSLSDHDLIFCLEDLCSDRVCVFFFFLVYTAETVT